jgi:formylglycine-generating enzyme required for sulfatase activity
VPCGLHVTPAIADFAWHTRLKRLQVLPIKNFKIHDPFTKMPRIVDLVSPAYTVAGGMHRARGSPMELKTRQPLVREDASSSNMVYVPGGTFRMGSDRHYPEEAPAGAVRDAALADPLPHTPVPVPDGLGQ